MFNGWAIKWTPNATKLGRRPTGNKTTPHANFHPIQSPFDTPTDIYSGNIVGLTSDVFGLENSRRVSLLCSLSPRLSAQPTTTHHQAQHILSCQPAALLARASENCPGPDPDSRHHWIRIIPKHLQNISVLFTGLPNLVFLELPDFDRRVQN